MAYVANAEVINLIWHDVHQRVPKPRIAEVANQVAAGFADARLTAYVPIFVRRATRDLLLPESRRRSPDVSA